MSLQNVQNSEWLTYLLRLQAELQTWCLKVTFSDEYLQQTVYTTFLAHETSMQFWINTPHQLSIRSWVKGRAVWWV